MSNTRAAAEPRVWLGRDPGPMRRFITEARTTARLDHPGVVPVHDLGLLPDGKPGTSGPQALWGVADAAAAHARLLALGATALEPVTEVGEGIKVAAVTDPFGNRLGIIENPVFDLKAVR